MSILLKKCLNSNNVPNMILYGHRGVDKVKIIYDNLKIETNNLINLNEYIKKYKNIFIIESKILKNIDEIKNIIKVNDLEGKTMIFINIDKCKKIIQEQLRVIVEKYRITTKFIFITDNYSNINDAIKSRCLSIRFPYKIYSNKEINDCISPITRYVKVLFVLYNKEYDDLEKDDIKKIKDLTYEYYKTNLSYNELLYELINECSMSYHWTIKKKIKFIEYISGSEHLYKKSYRFIIHLESLLINLYYLTTNHYKIDR